MPFTIVPNIKEPCHNILNCIGETFVACKIFRSNFTTFQVTSIGGKAAIDIMNAYRGTTQLLSLAGRLSSAFISDIFSPLGTLLRYFKPINVTTIHQPGLVERIASKYTLDKETVSTHVESYFKILSDSSKGNQFGFANKEEFLEGLQKHFSVEAKKDLFNGKLTVEVPLIKMDCLAFTTVKVWDIVGVMTVISYLNEWNLINTASWAASLGQTQVFSLVNHLDFNTMFIAAIATGFTLAVIVAVREIYSAYATPRAKVRAKFEGVGAAAEAVFHNRILMINCGIIKNNALFTAISLFFAKMVNLFCFVERPQLNSSDTSKLPVAEESLFSRIQAQIDKFTKPITSLPPVAYVAGKVNDLVVGILETLNDFISPDGADKLLKIIFPLLSLRDIQLKANGLSPVCAVAIKQLEAWKDLLYATKIFTVLPKYLVKYDGEDHYHFATPFYKFNAKLTKYQTNLVDGFAELFLDIGVIFDTLKFFHRHIAPLNYFVEIGNNLANRQVPILGYLLDRPVYIKEVPVAREINVSLKSLGVILSSIIKITKQLVTLDFYETTIMPKEKKNFDLLKFNDLLAHIGRVVICTFRTYGDTVAEQSLSLFVGILGIIPTVVRNRQYRLKVQGKAASAA